MSDDPLVDAIHQAIKDARTLELVRVVCLSVSPFLVSINGQGSVPALMVAGSSWEVGESGPALLRPGSKPVCLKAGTGGGGGSSFVRTTSTPVVTSIGAGSHATVTIPLAKSFRLLAMIVNAECRVRLFATAAGAAADIGRPVTDDPPDGRGVILDYVTTFAGTFLLSPLVDGSSMESVPSSAITAVVDNPSGSTASISVSFDYIRTE